MHRDSGTGAHADAEGRRGHPPRVAGAMKSGVPAAITTWSGRQLRGKVLEEGPAGSRGYAFLPWPSMEQVDIPEVAHRRGEFLQGWRVGGGRGLSSGGEIS